MGKINLNVGWLLITVLALVWAGCGGAKGAAAKKDTVHKTAGGTVVSEQARADFKAAVQVYNQAEKAGWTKQWCEKAIDEFEDVADDNGNMLEAVYNVGVIQRRCGDKKAAKATFKSIVKSNPKDQRSLTHLAVFALEEGQTSAAESYLKKAVSAGMNRIEVVPAFVNVAIILSKRAEKGDDKAFDSAVMNLRRALAIDANYVDALYQLGLLYYNRSIQKNKASFLDLATLVCSQAIQLNPEYGPIYHLLGQVQLRQQKLVQALQSFQTAFQKDPTLFESYMNYGAINLNFRGYEEAKVAFEKAIALDPKNYDSHIGLGVALRGLGDYKGARAEYKKAAQIEPGRTDYIFNVGLLTMDYENDGTPAGYVKAKKVFQKFLKNATPELKEDPDGKGPQLSWYAKAEARIKACDKAIKQIKEAEREMREMERLAKEQAEREAEMKRQMEKAKELEQKEAAGEKAPEEGAAPAPAAGADSAPKADEKSGDAKKEQK